MEYMLDTDSCIYLINRHPQMLRKAPPGQCAISVIVLGELERAVRRSNQPQPIVEFIKRINIVDVDASTALAYAEIRVHLESIGQLIGPNDLWIAAHAQANGVALVTNNIREFSRVPNLTIETWMSS